MADFLAVLGVFIFAVVMLGLIWALERVWASSRACCSASRWWCSSTWVSPCSSRSGS